MGNNRPRIPMAETLQGLKIKLLEGNDFADELRKTFGREKIQSDRIFSHIQNNVRSEVKVKLLTRETASHLIHRPAHLYKKSKKHISKVQKYLSHVHKNETRFLDEHTDFNDLHIKVESILQELDSAILELRHSDDDTDDENNELTSDEENSESHGLNNGKLFVFSCKCVFSFPSSPDRKQIYDHLRIILCESYDKVNELQEAFTRDQIESKWYITVIRELVRELEDLLIIRLSNEDAQKIAENQNKVVEKYVLQQSVEIITSVKNKLTDVNKHLNGLDAPDSTLLVLIDKLEKDCLRLLENQIELQKNNEFAVGQRTDEGETDRSSEIRKQESCKILQEVGKNGLGYSVETFKNIEGRFDQYVEDFMLLYECTLILQNESYNYLKIYSFFT